MVTERQLRHLKIIFVILLAGVLLVLWVDYNQNRTILGLDLSQIPNTIDGWEAVETPKSDDDQKRADAGDLVIRRYSMKENNIYLVRVLRNDTQC